MRLLPSLKHFLEQMSIWMKNGVIHFCNRKSKVVIFIIGSQDVVEPINEV